MPPKSKRPWTSTRTSVSPPSLKRRAVESTNTEAVTHNVPNPKSVRVFSWNVNGVGPLLQKRITFDTDTAFPLRKFLKRHAWPQFVCLQEVKISSRDQNTQRQLQHAANAGGLSTEPSYTIEFSLPRDRYNAIYGGGKVYGVATLFRQDITPNIDITRAPDWDLEGRVLIHELANKVVLINGYWVNGTSNPYKNPITGTIEGTRHDHKLRFHQNMLDEVTRLIEAGKHVVMVGDMNVARSRIDGYPNLRTSLEQHVKNRFDFNRKFLEDPKGLQGIDVFRELHGETQKFTYHPRGCAWGASCDRVDLIIVNSALYESGVVRAADICDNTTDRGHSDHVPLWIEMNFDKLSRTENDELKKAGGSYTRCSEAVP